MTVQTLSAWNFGHTITESNRSLNFNEGSGELLAELSIGAYSLEDFATEVARVMTNTGTQDYTVTVDRVTRFITISATSNFDLLAATGSNVATSVWLLLGYSAVDLTATNSYEGDLPSGSQYSTQFILQRFVDFNDKQRAANSTVNESASGNVEVIKYGNIKLMECNITLATNIIPQEVIVENATGVDDLRTFLEYAITKAPLEFIPDIDTPTTFTKCLLESTQEDSKGTGFFLRELYSRGLTGYFETGTTRFREIN